MASVYVAPASRRRIGSLFSRQTVKRRAFPYLIFAVSAGLYLLPFMKLLLQGTDEGTLAVGAVRVVHGQAFARDFFEVIGPGTFYWLALFFKLFGVTFFAERICLFVTSLGTALAMYYLSRRVCKRFAIVPVLLLAGTYFGMLWPTVSHHVDSNCFALSSVLCMTIWRDKHATWLLLLSGVLAGATTCFLQPKGVLLLLALIVWLWIQSRRGQAKLSSLWALMFGYASIGATVLLYFWSRHALWDLLNVSAIWPSKHYGAMNVVPYAQGIFAYYWDHWTSTAVGGSWTVIVAAILIAPFVLVAALPILLPLLAVFAERNCERPEILLYWLCGAGIWLSEFHRKDISHLVFGAPLLIVLCVYYLQEYRVKIAEWALPALAVSAACLAGFNFLLALSAHSISTRVGTVAVFNSDPILTLLNEKVAPGEEIFAYPYCPMYYFLSATTNPTRYSLLMYNYNTSSQFEEVVRALEDRKVTYVVALDANIQEAAFKALFPALKPMRHQDLIIEPYLDSHYELVKDDGQMRLLKRRAN